jgi:hypothetical protein
MEKHFWTARKINDLNTFFGRSPSGRAIRCNALFVASQSISAAIPNAKKQKNRFSNIIEKRLLNFYALCARNSSRKSFFFWRLLKISIS